MGAMSSTPTIEAEPVAVRRWVRERQAAGRRVGFVPTMGALHEGHLSLVRASAERCDDVAVSIFVNPTQFGPGEDLERYPRDLNRDAELLASVDARLIFAPSVETMYPPGADTTVSVGELTARWEGEQRPHHFAGVTTIVAKLLNIVPADAVFFGQKDYQQCCVVRRMIADLNLPSEMHVEPTVREPDGLAMSSRNAYLSSDERRRALCLSRGLSAVCEAAAAGERETAKLEATLRDVLREGSPTAIDYAAVVDRDTLAPLERLDRPAVALAAIRLGSVRLIDNILL